MPKSWIYDVIYRFGAPWEIGVRSELSNLVQSGRLAPEPGQTAIDLGCGTGANTIFLAQSGWDAVGVDFSAIAVQKANARAHDAGADNVRFVVGDLTGDKIEGAEGPFDFLLDYGTLDDFKGENRRRVADLATSIAKPGATFLLWCFYARIEDLPRVSFKGASKMSPSIEPGEMERLFGRGWEIEHLSEPAEDSGFACFLLTRRMLRKQA